MKNFKRFIALCLVVSTLLAVLMLTSCNITDLFSNNTESIIDDVMTSDNYTVEFKSESDVYTTVKMSGGQMHVFIKKEKETDAYYLYYNEESGKYYYAYEWKREGAKETEFEKRELKKEEYIILYMETFDKYVPTAKAFDYRHILEMAEPVGDDHYSYSKEIYKENEFSRTEYTIKITNDQLVFLSEHTEKLEGDDLKDEEGNSITVKIVTERTTYFDIGDTEITVPNKIKNK